MKDIKDYLPYYLKVWGKVSESTHEKYTNGQWALSCGLLEGAMLDQLKFTPYLRKLSDINDQQAIEIADIIGGAGHLSEYGKVVQVKKTFENIYKTAYNIHTKEWFDLTHYLLSKSFDLFGLIDEGLAIDKATLQQ